MARTLLINPRRRATAKQIAWRKKFAQMYGGGGRGRKRSKRKGNPTTARVTHSPRPVARTTRGAPRSAPAVRYRTRTVYVANPRQRRRRNPIGGMFGSPSSYVSMIRDGFVGGAGAIAVDLAMGRLNRFLPAWLIRIPGQPGLGDAVKLLLTVAAGKILARPTRGLSTAAAKGALAVQAHGILASFLPPGMTMGYASPSPLTRGQGAYIGPNSGIRLTQRGNMAGFTNSRAMLQRFSGSNAMLSRAQLMHRESVVT